MLTFISIIHIIIAVLLIGIVLIQDSKGGGLGMMGGGGGSNSILGATGADNVVAKATRWIALCFAITCVGLTLMTTKGSRSVLDSAPLPTTAPAVPIEAVPAPSSNEVGSEESTSN